MLFYQVKIGGNYIYDDIYNCKNERVLIFRHMYSENVIRNASAIKIVRQLIALRLEDSKKAIANTPITPPIPHKTFMQCMLLPHSKKVYKPVVYTFANITS